MKSIEWVYARYVALEEGILTEDMVGKLAAGDKAEAVRILKIRQESLRKGNRILGASPEEIQSMIDSVEEAIEIILHS